MHQIMKISLKLLHVCQSQERDPAATMAEPTPGQPSDAVEGYVPRHPKSKSADPPLSTGTATLADTAKKVRFAASAKQEARPAHPDPRLTGTSGSALDAFLKGRPMPSADAFEVVPIPADCSNPGGPSIEELLDQGQALRRQQSTQSRKPGHSTPAGPSNPAPQSINDRLDEGQALRHQEANQSSHSVQSFPATATRKSTPAKLRNQKSSSMPTSPLPLDTVTADTPSQRSTSGSASSTSDMAAASPATALRSQRVISNHADSNDGSPDGSEMDDQWDDYGVIDDDQLEGTSRAPLLHGSAGPADSDDDPIAHMANGPVTQPAASTLPTRLLHAANQSSSRQQGPIVERLGSTAERPNATASQLSQLNGHSFGGGSAPTQADSPLEQGTASSAQRPVSASTSWQANGYPAQVNGETQAAEEIDHVHGESEQQDQRPQIILDIDGDAADGLAEAIGRLKVSSHVQDDRHHCQES